MFVGRQPALNLASNIRAMVSTVVRIHSTTIVAFDSDDNSGLANTLITNSNNKARLEPHTNSNKST